MLIFWSRTRLQQLPNRSHDLHYDPFQALVYGEAAVIFLKCTSDHIACLLELISDFLCVVCPETSLAVPPAPVAASAFIALASSMVSNTRDLSHRIDARAGLAHLIPLAFLISLHSSFLQRFL